MSEPYITIYGDYVYFSRGTESYMKDRFDILEWGDSLALVPSDSGWYKIHSTKIGRLACWEGFAGYLQKRYPDHKGYFRLASVPVQRNEFPKGTHAFVFNASGNVDSRYEYYTFSYRRTKGYSVIRQNRITVFVRAAQMCAKYVDVFKKDRVFVIVPCHHGEFTASHSMKKGNHFTIENQSLVSEMLAVANRFDYVWNEENTYYITDQPEYYRAVDSLDGFTRLRSAVPPPPRQPTPWARSFGNYLTFPKKCEIKDGDRINCYEFGETCAFVVHPSGRLNVRSLGRGQIGISSLELRTFLIDKYQSQVIQFHVATTKCHHPDYPEETRVILLATSPIRKTLRFGSRFTRKTFYQKENGNVILTRTLLCFSPKTTIPFSSGRADIYKRNDIYAIVPTPAGSASINVNKEGNRFTLAWFTFFRHENLQSFKRMDVWKANDIIFFSGNPNQFRSVETLDGFQNIELFPKAAWRGNR